MKQFKKKPNNKMVESTKRSKKHDVAKTQKLVTIYITAKTRVFGNQVKEKGMVVKNCRALHCASEYNRGAGCGKTAGPDLHGGLYVNVVPTITAQ